jgi:hypothetical protein
MKAPMPGTTYLRDSKSWAMGAFDIDDFLRADQAPSLTPMTFQCMAPMKATSNSMYIDMAISMAVKTAKGTSLLGSLPSPPYSMACLKPR